MRAALVTGAGQGIRQAIALALAKRGARVIATDLAAPEATVSRIGKNGFALSLDVTREEDWRSAGSERLFIDDIGNGLNQKLKRAPSM